MASEGGGGGRDTVRKAVTHVLGDGDESESNSADRRDRPSSGDSRSRTDASSEGGTVPGRSGRDGMAAASGGESHSEETREGTPTLDGGELPRSLEVRLDHLSARVSAFNAYTRSLEGFIDEHGTASEFLDRIDTDLEAMDDRLEACRDRVETVDRTQTQQLETVSATVTDLQDEVGEMHSALEAVRERQDSIQQELEELQSFRESLAGVFDPEAVGPN